MSHAEKPKAIDLFCGCGGISIGLQNAGFEVLCGIDIEKKYIVSFEHNFPQAKALNTDITKKSPHEFMQEIGIEAGELDLLVGGPPCQGFSKNVPRKNRYLDDPKNLLVSSFLDYCEAIRPKMILMENVAEMKSGFDETYSQEVISRLEQAGYTVTSTVLNSADYGVPQKRRRAFFMANRLGVKFSVPRATHQKDIKAGSKTSNLFNKEQTHVNVWDAIGDLPSVQHGEGVALTSYTTPPQNSFQKEMRGSLSETTNHVAKKLAKKQFERISSLLPGQGHKDLPDHLKTKGGYSGAYGRLTKDMIAPTITRWVFHIGSGRWGHPIDLRSITIREAARLQSFPDNYEFLGSYTDQSGQLGNAVPPLLAKAVIGHMASQLELLVKPLKNSQETLSDGNLKAIA
jgi:DNA (cytosine-5)-methyltransferase 1